MQAAQQGLFKQLKAATYAKALLFPAAIEALGERGTGLTTEVWWSPSHPFKSNLTGKTSAEYASAYTSETGKQWTQPLGFKHANIEVAIDVLKRCEDPENPNIDGISISQLSGFSQEVKGRVKNAVIVSTGVLDWNRPSTWTGALDRSPCGTGTCAKMAVMHAKNQLALGEEFPHEGPLGTVFTGRLIRETEVGEYKALVPSLTGSAWVTGFAEYVLDANDPFPEGFTVGDIWG